MSGRVLVTDHVFDNLELTHEILDPLGVELVEAPARDEATLADLARDCVGIIVCYAILTGAVIKAAATGGCRIISRTGIGVDNIDVAQATEHGIQVTNVPDYCLDEVADHTMALLLAGARGIVAAREAVASAEWRGPAGVHRLRGQRLALIGIGAIGRRVAERAAAFGFEVVAHDPPRSDWEGIPAQRVDSLVEAVAEADAISLHAPLTEGTRYLVNDELLNALRHAPLLVNTSRGALVDADAVLRALDDGRLSGVALDVTEPEPLPPDHPLRRHPKAIVTPHMAYFSIEAQDELQRRAAEEVARALSDEPPRSPVNTVPTPAGTTR